MFSSLYFAIVTVWFRKVKKETLFSKNYISLFFLSAITTRLLSSLSSIVSSQSCTPKIFISSLMVYLHQSLGLPKGLFPFRYSSYNLLISRSFEELCTFPAHLNHCAFISLNNFFVDVPDFLIRSYWILTCSLLCCVSEDFPHYTAFK